MISAVSQYHDVVSVKYLSLLHYSTYHCFIAVYLLSRDYLSCFF